MKNLKEKLEEGSLVPIHQRVVGDKRVGVLNKDLIKAVLPLLKEIFALYVEKPITVKPKKGEIDIGMSREQVEKFLDFLEELLKEDATT